MTFLRWCALLSCVAHSASLAQGSAQPGPAAHTLGAIVATAPITFGSVNQVVSLRDGRVLVVDGTRRLVSMLDANFRGVTIILDSTAGRANSYATTVGAAAGRGGGRGGALGTNFLVPFRGDSTLWYDQVSGAFQLLAPNGTIGRTIAQPTNGGTLPFSPSFGPPFSSGTLGLIYKRPLPPPEIERVEGAADTVIRWEAAVAVLRMNFETHATDTLGRYAPGTGSMRSYTGQSMMSGPLPIPFPFVDNAVVTTDGAVAIFRAREYRIDWITPEGKQVAGARLPYPWRRISDQLREHMLDSVNGGRTHDYDSLLAKRAADSTRTGAVPMTTIIEISGAGNVERAVPMPLPRRPIPMLTTEIPDYFPPTQVAGDVLADADNHIWIRPIVAQPEPDVAVWDVVSRAGGLIDRVRVPTTRTIAGFGPGGIVYLVARDAGVATLEKVRVR